MTARIAYALDRGVAHLARSPQSSTTLCGQRWYALGDHVTTPTDLTSSAETMCADCQSIYTTPAH